MAVRLKAANKSGLGQAAHPDHLRRAVGVTWALVMAWVFFVAARDHHPVFTSQNECGTDPRDFLRAGELLEKDSLRFIEGLAERTASRKESAGGRPLDGVVRPHRY